MAEVEHLFDGVVGRRTNQGLILQYLARNYVRGEGAAKEHAIAVEALGRGADFDPKREAIVRVEMYKLRRTLKEYYAGAGRRRTVKIALAVGRYELEVEGLEAKAAEVEVEAEPEPAAGPEVAPDEAWRGWGWVAALVAGLLVAGYFWVKPRGDERVDAAPVEAVAAPKAGVRILAGGAGRRYVDSMGQEWEGDRYFTGGRAVGNGGARILNTTDQEMFRWQREGDFVYEIPLAAGDYEVRLHVAEAHYGKDNLGGGGESSRRFQVSINGKQVEDSLDVILVAGGPNLAVTRIYPGWRPEADGKLRVRFESRGNDKAIVNAIEVVPGLKDRMLPVRITAGATQATVDGSGKLWLPDRYVMGGRTVERVKAVVSSTPELYRFERFGRFEYSIPAVAGHQYQLKLWMAEQYFGVLTGLVNRRARLFDIYCNGTALARDLAVLEAAGGPGRGVERVYTHITPDGQGNVRVLFTPGANYAVLNAIELIDEGPGGRFR